VSRDSFLTRARELFGRHRRLLWLVLAVLVIWAALAWIGSMYKPLSPAVLMSKEGADAAKRYILGFGPGAPAFFIGLQVLQVVVAPIPGQAAGFAGGYVFGWRLGILYTMIGLGLGSGVVFVLSRKLGRKFVEKLNGAEAMKDFEHLFFPERAGGAYEKSKEAVGSHPLMTFFIIMLLPGLPDDLVCFIAGLTGIPLWQLMLATLVARFPGMLVLSLAGDGFSQAETNRLFVILVAATLLLTLLYFWKKDSIESFMRRMVGAKGSS
jgi:uncharacterized membrane protein YdjX (TVP38/TMEM64 family)